MNNKIKYSIECLKLVTDEFDENNVPYWLDYGTLLGAYRESTLISYDYDMDIGVEIKYSDKIKSILDNKVDGEKLSTGACCIDRHKPIRLASSIAPWSANE